MKKGEKITDKVVAALTKDFDADGDIIVGDGDTDGDIIMIRSGSPSDKEYNITIEKVSADPDDEDNKNYDGNSIKWKNNTVKRLNSTREIRRVGYLNILCSKNKSDSLDKN